MPGIHHPTTPSDPEMVTPHPREVCEQDRCGLRPWRIEDQQAYKVGYEAGRKAMWEDLWSQASEAEEDILIVLAYCSGALDAHV